jgi:nucleotide-binding universal stress UspA family protein
MSAVKWQRILVATDLSAEANGAVECAHTLAERFGAELHVLHVARNPGDAAAMYGATGAFEAGDVADQSQDWLRTVLGETGSVRRIESIQFGNDVVKKIKHYVRAQKIDLIVMATHGRNGMTRLWLGSITEEVIRSAHCPVLVLPPNRDEKRKARAATEPSAENVPAMRD